ncbi:MAG: cell division protein ZapA [Candidatus Binatia bacterium]
MKRKVKVDVAGHSLTLRSDEDEQYLRQLAAFVDRKIREVGRGQPGSTTLNLAISAAINIADSLYKLEVTQKEIDANLEAVAGSLEAQITEDS